MATYTEKSGFPGIKFSDETDGAIDPRDCPGGVGRGRGCRCGRCSVCGHPMHAALHGGISGDPPGGKPWAHKFIPAD